MAHFVSTFFAAALTICAFSLQAVAETKGDPATDPFWHRPILFIGADGGYNYVSPHATGELNKHGFQGDAKALLSYSWKDLTLDAGGGWLYNDSWGDASTGTVLHDGLTMEAMFVRLAGRYRFRPRWELGMLNHILFGADSRFQTTLPKNDNVNWFAGLEAVYRIPTRFPIQLSGAFLTDLMISSRQVYQFLLGIQIGFPLTNPRTKSVVAPVVEAPTQPVPTPTPEATPTPAAICPPAPTTIPRTYIFDLKRIQFDTNRSNIRPASMPMLKTLGKFLAQHPEAWDKLIIEGHTDQRGAAGYNQKLSERRAQSVLRALVVQGVNNSKVRAVGHGFSKPLVNESSKEAWQKNRRVEFTFDGVQQSEVVDKFIRDLNRDN